MQIDSSLTTPSTPHKTILFATQEVSQKEGSVQACLYQRSVVCLYVTRIMQKLLHRFPEQNDGRKNWLNMGAVLSKGVDPGFFLLLLFNIWRLGVFCLFVFCFLLVSRCVCSLVWIQINTNKMKIRGLLGQRYDLDRVLFRFVVSYSKKKN